MSYANLIAGGQYVHSTAIHSSGYMKDHMSYNSSCCRPTDYVYVSSAGIQEYQMKK
ncbi:hypothetical protein KY349_03555 [Candidatus Woesearchaeota archaeon]|nr:hypothetical protein [Candidatus Woesearchaeota archaeon]